MVQPLFKVTTIQDSLNIVRQAFGYKTFFKNRFEQIDIIYAVGRILAEDIIATENIPGFDRSTVDGFAVKASDTYGASDSLPAYLDLIGEIKMSERPSYVLQKGQTVKISTGGMLPEGADSVVMLEYTEYVNPTIIEISRPVSPWENVLREDEDIKRNEKVFTRGHYLKAADVGLLAALGWERIKVFKKPVIAIISTGDEIVPISVNPEPGQVRDINTYSLAAAVQQIGCLPFFIGIIKDEESILQKELQKCLDNKEIDLVLISGGSSVGMRDYTLTVLNNLGSPGVLVHGLAVKPGKPTIIALIEQKIFIGLPGHPVSAMMVFDNVVKKIIFDLKGEIFHWGQRKTVDALLENNVFSDAGREEYISVILKDKNGQLWAEPILGKSGLISSLAAADGYITIGLNREGLYRGEKVRVTLFD